MDSPSAVSWYEEISCTLKDRGAYKVDGDETYTIISRKYVDGSIVLTTLDPAYRYSKLITKNEVEELQ